MDHKALDEHIGKPSQPFHADSSTCMARHIGKRNVYKLTALIGVEDLRPLNAPGPQLRAAAHKVCRAWLSLTRPRLGVGTSPSHPPLEDPRAISRLASAPAHCDFRKS
jgi:hypothetical protein